MAKWEIEIADIVVPDGLVVVAYRIPLDGEWCYFPEAGEWILWQESKFTASVPRLIAVTKKPPKTVRPYNAEEMKRLYIGRARLVCGNLSFDVVGHDAKEIMVLAGRTWLSASDLFTNYTHLDGTRCEVVEES